MRVGVLALQGAFREHVRAFSECGATAVEVRTPEDLEQVEALVIPGGESTTIGKLMVRFGLLEAIQKKAAEGMAVWGTCAGMIVMAKEVLKGLPDQPLLGLMDMQVERNAFGRQLDSFETDLDLPFLGPEPFPAVFIRAPLARRLAPQVEVLGTHQGVPVALRQGRFLATAFHPELSVDRRLHRWFLRESSR